MDVAQQFCLRWNNYQSTLHHIFHKLWLNGTFVDVSLVVEGRKIDCHKMILSACSTYFEQLLREHSSHPHPLILLHDIPYSAVESLVSFMYNGEINVSHDQLTALLKVADILKIKGLADSAAISDFTKLRLLGNDIAIPNARTQYYPSPYLQDQLYVPNTTSSSVTLNGRSSTTSYMRGIALQNTITHNNQHKQSEVLTNSNSGMVHPKKRPRLESPTSLLPSPPTSLEDTQNHKDDRASPHERENHSDELGINCPLPQIKIEIEEETDNELQIDESAGQSPEDSAESEGLSSNRETPVTEFDSQELRERHETAQSLAALASQGFPNILVPTPSQLLLAPKTNSLKIKEEKNGHHGGKNGEKAYTFKDLEEGIEAVLTGVLTPAKAIAKYKVPRRTFFRRLSSVRKQRGIPSSKENAAENYHSSKPSANTTALQTRNLPIVISGLVPNEAGFAHAKSGIKVVKENIDDLKKQNSQQSLQLPSGGVLNFLQVANSSYEYYIKCLKMQNLKQPKDIKKETIDDNSNISSSETTEQHPVALVTQNGS